MRRVQKRAAAAGGDLLDGRAGHRGRRRLLVAAVVVQIASQIDLHVDAMPRKHLFAQKNQIGLVEHAPGRLVLLRVDPRRHRQAEDRLVARLHVLDDDLAEVLDLRHVEIALQLAVAADQPPVVRELEDEVTAALPRPPAGEAAAADVGAEEPRERGKPVVPIVVAGHGVDVRPLDRRIVAEGGGVRRDEAALVFLAARTGVDLIAAEDEHVGARQA